MFTHICYPYTSEYLGGIADDSLHSSILECDTSPFCDNLVNAVILIVSIKFSSRSHPRISEDPCTDTLKN